MSKRKSTLVVNRKYDNWTREDKVANDDSRSVWLLIELYKLIA